MTGAAALLFGTGARRTNLATQQAYDGTPNILIVLTDDQPPNTLDAMGDFASRFDRDWTGTAYSDVPVCGPARVGLLTGKYPHNHGATLNGISWQVYRDRDYAADDLLSRVRMAGYNVGYFGKVINGYGSPDDAEWVHPAAEDYPHRWRALAGGQQKPYRVNFDGTLRGDITANQTTFFGRRAQEWMSDRAGDAKPWLCYLALTDPHVPHTPTKAYGHSHDGEELITPGTREEDLSDKSSWTLEQAGGSRAASQDNWEGTLEELEVVRARCGSILDALEAKGQLDNTLVIYTSDNGYMHGEHGGLSRKGRPYEESARVPFLVKMPAGHRPLPDSLLISRLDVTATVLDAAGADSSGIDGRSFWNLGGLAAWRRRLLVEHPGLGWGMVREGDTVYMRMPTGEEEMYDLVSDPYQLSSLQGDPERAEELAALSTRLEALRGASGEELRAKETA